MSMRFRISSQLRIFLGILIGSIILLLTLQIISLIASSAEHKTSSRSEDLVYQVIESQVDSPDKALPDIYQDIKRDKKVEAVSNNKHFYNNQLEGDENDKPDMLLENVEHENPFPAVESERIHHHKEAIKINERIADRNDAGNHGEVKYDDIRGAKAKAYDQAQEKQAENEYEEEDDDHQGKGIKDANVYGDRKKLGKKVQLNEIRASKNNTNKTGVEHFKQEKASQKNTLQAINGTRELENRRISARKLVEFNVTFQNYSGMLKMSSPEQNCTNETLLLIIVPSKPSSFGLRKAIRETWGSTTNLPPNVRIYFLLGIPTEKSDEIITPEQIKNALSTERTEYADIIMTDIIDIYTNLHFKTHACLLWKEHFCKASKFLLKNDEDTIVHVPRLLFWIEEKFLPQTKNASGNKTIFGVIIHRGVVIRQRYHKWYVPYSVYPFSRYPDYVNGPSYLQSSEAVSALLGNTKDANQFPMEDVLFNGIIAEKAGVEIIESIDHFRTYGWVRPIEMCNDASKNGQKIVPQLILLHFPKAKPQSIYDAFEFLTKLNCGIRNVVITGINS